MKIEERNGYIRIEYSPTSHSSYIGNYNNDIKEFKNKFNLTDEARINGNYSELRIIRVQTGGMGNPVGFRNDMYVKYNGNYYIIHYYYEKEMGRNVIIFDATEPVTEKYVRRRIETCKEGASYTKHFTNIGKVKYDTKTSYDFHYIRMSDMEKELLL